jgi:N-acyl-D-amino-acid deacylase
MLNRTPDALRLSLVPLLLLALMLPGVGGVAGQTAQQPDTLDLVLRGGRILDGLGNPWFRGDVGITGDRIMAVGNLSRVPARRIVELAENHYVAPGFIDTHSHAGGGLGTPAGSMAEPLLAQGITTVFVNPDGGGPVDLVAQRRGYESRGIGVNVAQFVPHGSVRGEVLGMADRAPSASEMDRMRSLVRRGMEEGAWGLSSGPFYAPGSFSDTDELVELARVVAEFGGAYQSHIRDESDYTVGLMAAVEEVVTVAAGAGIPGVVTHVKALGPPVWGFSLAVIRRIEAARAAGIELYADQYPYIASATGLGAALLPRWAEAGGRDSLNARLDDPATRARVREAVVENLARRGGADRIQFRLFEPEPAIEGRTLADVARERGVEAPDAALQLLRRGSPGIVSFNMDERDVQLLMAQPWTMTASDGDLPEWGAGVPHPRSYGSFPRKLRTYVVEQQVLPLEAAIRTMTGLPASVYRMPDRGRILPGMAADLVVFDLDEVRDPATFTEPHQLSEGMVHVLVNGVSAVDGGAFTGERPGRVLRRP